MPPASFPSALEQKRFIAPLVIQKEDRKCCFRAGVDKIMFLAFTLCAICYLMIGHQTLDGQQNNLI